MNDDKRNLVYEGELAHLKKIAPIKGTYWARKELLTACEAVLLYYGIDPEGSHGINEFGFELQIRNLDEDKIYELLKDSFRTGSLEMRLGNIRVQDFCVWLVKKGLAVPECLRSHPQEAALNSQESMPLNTVPDVLKLDFSAFSPAVLAAFGTNVIAEICIRKAVKEGKKDLKAKDVLKTNMLKELLALCAAAEGKDEKAEDTIRGYIEHRFQGL